MRAGKLAVAARVARVLPGDEDGDAEEWAKPGGERVGGPGAEGVARRGAWQARA